MHRLNSIISIQKNGEKLIGRRPNVCTTNFHLAYNRMQIKQYAKVTGINLACTYSKIILSITLLNALRMTDKMLIFDFLVFLSVCRKALFFSFLKPKINSKLKKLKVNLLCSFS